VLKVLSRCCNYCFTAVTFFLLGLPVLYSTYEEYCYYGRPMEQGRPFYFCPLVSSIFCFFPRLISAVEDWMSAILNTWCGLRANLECSLKWAACGSLKIQDAKNRQKFTIWAPLHNIVRLYLCNQCTYRQSEKNWLNSNPHVLTIWWTSAH